MSNVQINEATPELGAIVRKMVSDMEAAGYQFPVGTVIETIVITQDAETMRTLPAAKPGKSLAEIMAKAQATLKPKPGIPGERPKPRPGPEPNPRIIRANWMSVKAS